MALAGIAMVVACICIREVPGMWRRREIRELWLFGAMLALGSGIAVAISLHIAVPNPLDGAAVVFRPIGRLVEAALGAGGGR